MTHSAMRRRLASLVVLVAAILWANWLHSLSDVYVSQAGGGTGGNCGSPRAGSSLTSGDWVADTTIHLCGTWTGVANQSPFITALGNGTSGHPITVLFEPGAVLQAPYFSSSNGGVPAGAITLGVGRSFITVDGNNLQGTIQNTANGSNLANHQASTGISALSCNTCTIKNLNVNNIYVNVQGNGSFGDNQTLRAIDISGSNAVVSGNKIHDCGWCIFTDWANGDVNYQMFNNEVYNFGHAFAFETSKTGVALGSPSLILHDNYMHDTFNWDGYIPPAARSCPFHQDGLHTFAQPSDTFGDIIMYNNKFAGDWGNCPTGFVFMEGASSSTPTRPGNVSYFNNVHIINPTGRNFENTQGWVGLFGNQAPGSTTLIANNTFTDTFTNSNDTCIGISMLAVTFKNNAMSGCGTNIDFKHNGGVDVIDYNFYGSTGNPTGFNGWKWNPGTGTQFIGTFAGWKSACACDSHGVQNNSANFFSATAVPTPTYPGIKFADNLGSLATGNLAALASDSSAGNTRTPALRPPAGTCSSQGSLPCWDIGAIQATGAPVPPAAPTNLAASVSGSTVTLTGTASAGSPIPTGYSLYRGTVHGGPYSLVKTALSSPNTTDTPPNGTWFYTETAFVGGLISTINGNGSTATVTCMTACPSFPTGTPFTIGGNSTAGFNGTFTSTGQPTNATFTFASSTSSIGSGGAAWPTGQESAKSNEVQATVPAAATLSLAPTSLTFAAHTVGSPSPTQTVTVTNTSGAGTTITFSGVTFGGSNPGDFSRTTTCTTLTTPGQQCQAVVTFTPTAPGTRSALLTFVDNATGSPQTVPVSGTGVAQTPIITLTPASHDFGSQMVSTTSTAFPFTLTNSGTGTATITSITPSGDFAVFSTTCGGTLGPASTCFINVNFTPTVTGGRAGSLSVVDSAAGSPHVATLQGTGINTKCQLTGGTTLSGQATVCGP